MSINNGMSDTKSIPIPKPEQTGNPPPAYAPGQPGQVHPPAYGARQRAVQQSMQRTAGMQQPGGRQSAMRGTVPRQRPAQRRTSPPQAGIRRASWDGNFESYSGPPQSFQPPPVYDQPEEFQDEEPVVQKHRRKRRKRRHSCLRRLAISAISFIFTIFVIYSVIAIIAIRKIQTEKTGERHITANAAVQDSKVRNVLLIGTDARGDERGRADTIMLLSFSRHNHTMTMTSLMRDSYVNIPGYGANKLNAAYAYGGATLLMDTIINNFGIRVDEYICVNFSAFVHLADAVGGVKVKITDKEAQAINAILQTEVNEIMGDDPKADFLPSGGTFVLNGKQALSYSRIRKVGNADFERTERQRNVMELILDKLKLLKPSALTRLLKNALPEFRTNISSGRLYWLSLKLPYELIFYDKQSLRLPADGTFDDQTAPDGQMVLAVDFEANRKIYEKAVKSKSGLQTGSAAE
ncbi:MAG: LCP family protein [Oscillospiraceae bacterium]|nr:LCP family protein [Oscillospiraceae bacterium]